ncbi:MAG: GldG family protein [Gammaproteobacteria bacterium]|nr:GldG family protein [Gammaproteobacteria bacterium]NNJ98076.1 GldG family protein [Gammaproteobacteria bacterium]
MKLSKKTRIQLQLQKIVFVCLLLIAVGLLGWLTNQQAIQFDWTSNKRNTLSQNSIDLLQTLDQPVQVNVYIQDDATVHAAVEEILQRYQREKADFNYRLINPDLDFESAQRDGVERYGQIVIAYNNQKEHIASLSEQNISSALLRLSRPDARKLVFIKGHGEKSPAENSNIGYSKLVAELENKGFTTTTHNLLLGEVPQDTSAVIITSPERAYLEGELELIGQYLDNGGNLLWMMDPGELHGLEPLADTLGIRFLDGIIVDNNVNLRNTLRIQHPAMIPVLDYYPHAVTENIEYNTLFPFSRGVEAEDTTFDSTVIAQSLAKSWSEADALGGEIDFRSEDGDIQGPIGVILALEKATATATDTDAGAHRVVVIGDSDFVADSYIGTGANLALAMNIFNWLAGDDMLIAIEPKRAPDVQLQLDDTEVMLIGVGFFLALPASLILAGVVIWLRRRNR